MSIEARLDHFGLFTNNLEKTISWYNKFLGFKVSDYLPPGNEKEALVAPDGISWMRYTCLHHDLALVQLPPGKNISVSDKKKSNLKKITFQIHSEESFLHSYKYLKTENFIFPEQLSTHPFFKCPSFSISDPNGNLIQILNRRQKLNQEFETDNNKTACVPIESLSHISINSKDMNGAADWYEDIFGMQKHENYIDTDHTNKKIAMSDSEGEIKLVICESLEKNKVPDLQQIAFRVKDNETVMSIHDFISNKNIPIIRKPFRGWTGWLRYYFEDFDGNKIEIESGMDIVESNYGFDNPITKKLDLQHVS